MIEEFKATYREFHDATIDGFEYYLVKNNHNKGSTKVVEVFINCWNWKSNNSDRLKLIFSEVKSFRFVEIKRQCSHVIFEALIIENEENVIFDFFPIQVDGRSLLKEDPDSDFSIHCKVFSYELLS